MDQMDGSRRAHGEWGNSGCDVLSNGRRNSGRAYTSLDVHAISMPQSNGVG